ncbi:Transcription factor MYB3R-3 [Hondaea fermentalgiana]|uniref:Transcription factor MYB3R-3 n=1 Tax=Hondaea fermentalgiana TaxID=2315210 RepID=A0A2R5GEY6_9STRA|nr:Transcription factor MYB3R-3 [Hondaea fermentalgiana]|eukprot:GBG26394.1 Transcription factor MYB3R-3 [Hondaea fermentalgiana]
MEMRLSMSELSIADEPKNPNSVASLGLPSARRGNAGGASDSGSNAGPNSASAAAADRRSRVRKAYSGRSNKFLSDEVVGKQKLRGPSGANLPADQQTRQIHMLEGLKREGIAAPAAGKPAVPAQTGQRIQPLSRTQQPQNSAPLPPRVRVPIQGPPSVASASSDDQDRKPNYWTPAEDAALKAAVDRFGDASWKNIASAVPGRTSTQCIQRWKKVLKPGLKKGHWSTEEDNLLVAGVRSQQAKNVKKLNWSEVAKDIPMRSCKQCRERWVNHLNPDVNKGSWTDEELRKLWELQLATPRKWAKIARQLPGRTENMVKVRWNILNRSKTKPSVGSFQDASHLGSLTPPVPQSSLLPPSTNLSSTATPAYNAGHGASVKIERGPSDKLVGTSPTSVLGQQPRRQNTIILKRDFSTTTQNNTTTYPQVFATPASSAPQSRTVTSGSDPELSFPSVEWDPNELQIRPLEYEPSDHTSFGVAPPDYPGAVALSSSSSTSPAQGAASSHVLASSMTTARARNGSGRASTSVNGTDSDVLNQTSVHLNSSQQVGTLYGDLSHLEGLAGPNALDDVSFEPIDFGDLQLNSQAGDSAFSTFGADHHHQQQQQQSLQGHSASHIANAAYHASHASHHQERHTSPVLQTNTGRPSNNVSSASNASAAKAAYQNKADDSTANTSSLRQSVSDFQRALSSTGNDADFLANVPQTFDDLVLDDDLLNGELDEFARHLPPFQAHDNMK